MGGWSTRWPAPAKINLFLHVTGCRPDGYHTLQTAFQFLDYGDELAFRLRRDGRIRLETALPGVAEADNLVVRAARRLQEETGTALGADIRLTKRLPQGGGLGGGSSDAATTLTALNQLWETDTAPDRLEALGLGLGADIPVFLFGRAAWAEGVGERLTALTPPQPWYLIAVPPVSVSTAEVFRAPELTRNCPGITIRDFLAGAGTNVCEPVVRDRYPEVDEVLHYLAARARARMTGTGACIFAPFENRADAEAALRGLPGRCGGFVARGVNRSPLLERAAGRLQTSNH